MGITSTSAPPLPQARGPLTEALLAALCTDPARPVALPSGPDAGDPWQDDVQLALYVCYELHYRGFAWVSDRWEWDPRLLALRQRLEDAFRAALRAELGRVEPLAAQLEALLIEPVTGTGPSYHLLERGERWQVREYLAQRSLYHLKEADPQAFALPRLHGAAQAAFVAIEFDEYGDGHPDRTHSGLFARMMADLGLDPSYGRYLDHAPAPALAVVNAVSLLALHRADRGALVGHFAGVEISSPPGSRRLADALRRLGAGPDGVRFYDEHVEADAVHEQQVRRGVIGALLHDEPELEPDVAFGLAVGSLTEERFGAHLLDRWQAGRSSLRLPLPPESPHDRAARTDPVRSAT